MHLLMTHAAWVFHRKTPERFHELKTYDCISNYILDLFIKLTATILCNKNYIKYYIM